MPNLVHPSQKDPLSMGLRTLATLLDELHLRAFITEDLFPQASSKVEWSCMRRLSVEFHPLRPDGSWYFVGSRGEDPNPRGFIISEDHYPPTEDTPEDEEIDEEWDFDPGGEEGERSPDLFRTEPIPEGIEPLLSAFASAAKNMGALEEAELFAYLWWHPSASREDEYGGEAPYDSDNGVHKWGVRYVPGRKSDDSDALGRGSV